MKIFKIILCSVVVFSIGIFSTQAQLKNHIQEIGGNLTGVIYQGDLVESNIGSFQTPGVGINVWAEKHFNEKVSARLGLGFFTLAGDDEKGSTEDWRKYRSLSFKSTVIDLAVHGLYNFVGSNNEFEGFKLYGLLGAGAGYHNINRDTTGFNLQEVSTGLAEDFKQSNSVIAPFVSPGLGIKYGINKSWGITGEFQYRLSFSDYLDGYSKAGNPDKGDQYYKIGIGVTYNFNVGDGKPTKAGKSYLDLNDIDFLY